MSELAKYLVTDCNYADAKTSVISRRKSSEREPAPEHSKSDSFSPTRASALSLRSILPNFSHPVCPLLRKR